MNGLRVRVVHGPEQRTLVESRGPFELLSIFLPINGDYSFSRTIIDVELLCGLFDAAVLVDDQVQELVLDFFRDFRVFFVRSFSTLLAVDCTDGVARVYFFNLLNDWLLLSNLHTQKFKRIIIKALLTYSYVHNYGL